jgi:methionine-gamma-lyase
MDNEHTFGPMTRLIHGRLENHKDNPFKRSHVHPVVQTSTFRYENVSEGEQIFSGSALHDAYSRISNPNHRELEDRLCVLEEGEAAQVFDSGMSAIKVAIQSLIKSGDHIIAHRNLYGGTLGLLDDMSNFNIDTTYVDARYISNVLNKIKKSTKIIILESPSNPMLDICDFEQISTFAHKVSPDIVVMVDSTFGTPINQKPLNHNVDIVIHSLTKYLNGFGTYIGGALISSQKMMDKIWERYHGSGGMMDPRVASDITHNMFSIYDRMKRHNDNAGVVTNYLFRKNEEDSCLDTIYYPGAHSHPYHHTASRLMSGYGGMVSFEITDADGNNTRRFLDKMSEDQDKGLGIISQAVSLGSMDTLICCPAKSTHLNTPREKRLTQGLTDNLIRLSVGTEDVEDIIYSLDRGFEAIKR